jgi:hypothetical protein
MQTIETPAVGKAEQEKAATPTVLRPPVECTQHRIYVWSSPSPYALVIEEARSFQPR